MEQTDSVSTLNVQTEVNSHGNNNMENVTPNAAINTDIMGEMYVCDQSGDENLVQGHGNVRFNYLFRGCISSMC